MLPSIFFSSLIITQTGLTKSNQEVMLAQYSDRANQEVSTLEGKGSIPINTAWSLGIKGLGEWIRVQGMSGSAHQHTATGHEGHGDHDPGGASMEMDAVSGASIQGHMHHGSGEGRGEATIALRHDWQGKDPASLSTSLRYSGEADFHSSMATLSGGLELFERNTAVSGYLSTGMDYSAPDESPPGQANDWPATSSRLAGGIQIGQILSPRIHSGVSYSLTVLSGTLENPYRRARIISTLFPERLPNFRIRNGGGLEIGGYLGYGMGLFHREGVYLDSWGIAAWIPETALQIELGNRWMLIPKHKYYYQLSADFYKTAYANLDGWHTGDIRLGHLESEAYSFSIEYSLGEGPNAASLSLSGISETLTYLSDGNRSKSFIVALSWRSQ
jgi:hypothetical protein